jgi:type III secretion protein C
MIILSAWLRAAGCVILLFSTAVQTTYAAAIPFPDKKVTIKARNQGVDDVLRSLFGKVGITVKVSSAVNQKANGVFRGTPAEIWGQLAEAFNLVAFNDGAVVLIYPANEVRTRSFTTANAPLVQQNANRMGLVDAHNKVMISGTMVSATGVPAFLDRVASIVSASGGSPRNIEPVATPASASVISPLLAGTAVIPTVSSRLLSAATRRSPYEVRIFYLRYARADDTIQKSYDRTVVIPGIASILRGMMGDGRPSNTVSTSGNYDISRQSQPRLLGRGLSATPPDPSQADYDDLPDGTAAPAQRGPARRDVDGPRVEVDPSNNAVLIRDRPESMRVYEDIVRSLDVEPRGVEIEATIIELDVNRLRELGIDFNFQINGWAGLFGGQAQQPTNNFSQPGIGGSYVTGSGNGFALRINALEKNGVLRVVSRPRLSTLNNIPAVFNNQVQYYVRVAGDRQVDLFPVTAGMVMRVNPSVLFDGGELRTRLSIEILDGAPSGLIVDGIPAVKQSSINTNAVVKQGESLLIGGMTIDSEFDYKSKVPVLGDVPVLGQAFRKRSKGGQHFERLFLITPRVLSQRAATAVSAVTPVPLEQLQNPGRKRRVATGNQP